MSHNELKQRKTAKMLIMTIVLFVVAIVLVLAFTGCTAAVAKPAPEASAAAAPVKEEESAPEPEVTTTGVIGFGEVITYADDISISVSEPAPYIPSDLSAGRVEGQDSVAFEFVITNGSTSPFNPTMVYASLTYGGTEASGVFSTQDDIGFPPTTSVLPGQTIKWKQAWSVADPANLTLEVSAGLTYDDVIFTNIQ